MVRNRQLPASRWLSHISPRTHEPVRIIVVAAILAMLPLVVISKIPVIVAAITTLILVPYVIVLATLLVRRLQGWPKAPAQFRLGRWGLPITITALIWAVGVTLVAAWPRETTNPRLGPLPVIEEILIGVFAAGLLWWLLVLRRRPATLDLRGRATRDQLNARVVPVDD
jgi:amino acid transporter